ncbi:MAG: 1-deoxy-D-xylulose-5-phosphate reductoisomerase, partial [Calditrichaeota bacterium]|nr:1-deoxy-D-xylulose-5-phosphate reductoisomerase [Calditrichota bacterium]
MQDKKKIVVLGASGSIGVNSLNVVEQLPQDFQVMGLTTHTNVKLLTEQSAKHRPKFVAVTGRNLKSTEQAVFNELGITVFSGESALMQIVENADYDVLVNAVVGAAGFLPTLKALELKKN